MSKFIRNNLAKDKMQASKFYTFDIKKNLAILFFILTQQYHSGLVHLKAQCVTLSLLPLLECLINHSSSIKHSRPR